jgi:hypothetical protein
VLGSSRWVLRRAYRVEIWSVRRRAMYVGKMGRDLAKKGPRKTKSCASPRCVSPCRRSCTLDHTFRSKPIFLRHHRVQHITLRTSRGVFAVRTWVYLTLCLVSTRHSRAHERVPYSNHVHSILLTATPSFRYPSSAAPCITTSSPRALFVLTVIRCDCVTCACECASASTSACVCQCACACASRLLSVSRQYPSLHSLVWR